MRAWIKDTLSAFGNLAPWMIGPLFWLGACSALSDAPPPPAPAPIVAAVAQCPTIREFTPAENEALAKALRDPATAPIWMVVAVDDQKMRAQARACIAAKEGRK